MRRAEKFLVAGVVLLVMTGTVLAAYTPARMAVSDVSAKEIGQDQSRAIPVQAALVRLGPVETDVSYSGNIKVKGEVQLLSKISGRLEEIEVHVGDSVNKGDVIARIDARAATAQLMKAQAALRAAQIKASQISEGPRREEIAQSEASLKNAQAKLARMRAPLNQNEIDVAKASEVSARVALQQAQTEYDKIAWADGKGAMSQSVALQQATAAYESARAQYQEKLAGNKPEDIQAQEALVEQARAALALTKTPYRDTDAQLARANIEEAQATLYAAQLDVDECTIRASLDGVVSSTPLTVGAMVGSNTPVATLVTSQVEIAVRVEESSIPTIRSDQPATIHLAAYPDETFNGKVTRIAPTADETDRTFEVTIEPDEQNQVLRGGMFAQVNLITAQQANALLVPRSAVVSEGDKSFVFLVAGDRAQRREVVTGLSQEDVVQVFSGLTSGDWVVASGQAGLKNDDPVKVTAAS